jgi:hypothetical protein
VAKGGQRQLKVAKGGKRIQSEGMKKGKVRPHKKVQSKSKAVW